MSTAIISKINKFAERIKLGLGYEGVILRQVEYDIKDINFWEKTSYNFDAIVLVITNEKIQDLKFPKLFKKVFLISNLVKLEKDQIEENIQNFCLPVNYKVLADEIRKYEYKKYNFEQKNIYYKDIEINLNRREVFISKKKIFLRNKEFILLKYLIENRGRVLTRINIIESVWDINADVFTNTVDVHMSKLRRLFNGFQSTKGIIQTIHSVGYLFS